MTDNEAKSVTLYEREPDQMWERLAKHQPFADERGYGEAWAKMCAERTEAAVLTASAAAIAARERARALADRQAAWAASADARASVMALDWVEKAERKK